MFTSTSLVARGTPHRPGRAAPRQRVVRLRAARCLRNQEAGIEGVVRQRHAWRCRTTRRRRSAMMLLSGNGSRYSSSRDRSWRLASDRRRSCRQRRSRASAVRAPGCGMLTPPARPRCDCPRPILAAVPCDATIAHRAARCAMRPGPGGGNGGPTLGPTDTTATQTRVRHRTRQGFVDLRPLGHPRRAGAGDRTDPLPSRRGAGRRGAILPAGDQLVRDDHLAHRDARRAGAARHSIRAGLADRPRAEQIRRIGA